MPVAWKREDSVYAAAAAAAAALVVYFTIGNFGLVPTPLAPGGRGEAGHPVGVPSLTSALAAATSAPATAAPTTGATLAPSSPGASPISGDRTPPRVRITTASGTQYTVTEPAVVAGTASDADSGVRTVTVTFTSTAGGPSTVSRARLTCRDTSNHSCRWAADVPSVAGTYRVTARATDRASNARSAGPITITVVNGGGVVKTVTDLIGGIVGGLGRVIGSP